MLRTTPTKQTQQKFGYSQRSIKKWKKMYKVSGSVSDAPTHAGRKRKLGEQEEKRIVKLARTNVGITNVALARKTGDKVCPSTISNVLQRSHEDFGVRLIAYDYPDTFTKSHYTTGKKFVNYICRIPYYKRIYIDETWLSPKVQKKRARVPKGTHVQLPLPSGHKMTVILAICHTTSLNITTFFDGNSITTEQFEDWVKRKLVPLLKAGNVVIWDQLGKYGKEKKPYRLHWSPKAKCMIEAVGAKVVMLPPKGKLLNPIELYIRDIKAKYCAQLLQCTKNQQATDDAQLEQGRERHQPSTVCILLSGESKWQRVQKSL